jgi:periplasmic mercuric ion binding protein
MKISAPLIALVFALGVSAQADVSVKLTDVHLCCQSCVKGVQKAVSKVDGVKVEADKDESTVTLTGPDSGTVQKAVDAMLAGGYFGKTSDASITIAAMTGAKDQKVQSLQIEGVHLCCDKCVKAVNKAVEAVDGVKSTTAAKGAKSFTVTGDFNDKQVLDALQKAGLTGKVAAQ